MMSLARSHVRYSLVAAVLAAGAAAGQPPGPNPPAPPPGFAPTTPAPARLIRPARVTAPQPAGPRGTDRHGDPLPLGAVARFGSVRLRHGAAIAGLGFTSDGKYLVSVSATEDGLRLWDPATGKEVGRLTSPVQAAAIAPDRSVVFAADGKARVWEPFGGGRVRELPPRTLPDGGASALAVHPAGRLFAAATPAGIILTDLATGDTKATLRVPGEQSPIRLVFSPDGRWLGGAGPRTGVWLWDLATFRRVRTYPAPQADQVDFAFSPDGTRLVVAGGPLVAFHTDAEEPSAGFNGPDLPVQVARYSSDGKSLFALDDTGTLTRLDAATGEVKDAWKGAAGVAAQPPLAVAVNGAWVAAADDTGGIRVWNPRDGSGPAADRLTPLSDPGLSADGKTASAVTADGKVVTFDPATGAPGKVIETGLDGEGGLVWNARAGLVAGIGKVGDEGELHVVDVARRKVVAKLPLSPGEFPWVTFSPTDPTRLGVITAGTATVYDTRTGRPVRVIDLGQPEVPKQGALSPDGRLLAVTTSPASVWEVATGRKRFEVDGPAEAVSVEFSPDGRRLAVVDAFEVVVFDVRAGAVVRRLRSPGGESPFNVVAFTPDGTHLATGGGDGVVTLWDVASGEAVVAFDRHEAAVTGLTFSADGTRLVTSSVDGTALIWDATARPAASAAVASADAAVGLLAFTDATAAQRGMSFLHRTPAEAVRLLAERVPVPTAVPAERIARLVADLGSTEFPTRQAASRELEAISAEAGPALRAAVGGSPSPEVRRLAGELLDRLAAAPTRPDDLRAIRAVEVLEGIGTPAAREQLTRWAAGPANHRLTTEAAAAVQRLSGPRPSD